MDLILAKMRRERTGNPLSWKQRDQLIKFACETNLYLPFKEIAFLELMRIAKRDCFNLHQCPSLENRFKEHLTEFRQKYYPYGFKINKNIDPDKLIELFKIKHPRFASHATDPYNPIELVGFVMLQRACYKYITSENNEENTQQFVDKLKQIRRLIASQI